MAQEQAPPAGPDLAQGITMDDLVDDKVVGHVGSEEVLLVRSGSELFAVGAHCSHYHGPLADGLVAGDTVRCPWHHARFNLRTGEAIAPPALSEAAAADFTFDFTAAESVARNGAGVWADTFSDNPVREYCM